MSTSLPILTTSGTNQDHGMDKLHDAIANPTRRLLIKGLGTVPVALFAGMTLGGCEAILERIANRPIRRRLRTGSTEVDNDIAIYRDAVSQMKMLPASDPRSWAAQAEIHGTDAGFNFCQHNSPHFFTWHRAYLSYFERICRELTGEADWGLPYWNWNQNRSLHPAFTTPGSPLSHPRTRTDFTSSRFEGFLGDDNLTPMFIEPDLITFGGLIEGSPHNLLHGSMGGDMGGFTSARDPVFWMHHNMVDYCWWKWNVELGFSIPADPTWRNTKWTHFVDEAGDPAEITAIITSLMPVFTYRFEESDIGRVGQTVALSGSARPEMSGIGTDSDSSQSMRLLEDRLRQGVVVRTDVLQNLPLARGITMPLGRALSLPSKVTGLEAAEQLLTDGDGERSYIAIKHAQLPNQNDFMVRVFIDLPDANIQTSTDDPHFAGTYGFFGTHDSKHSPSSGTHGKKDFLINASPTLARLSRLGRLQRERTLSVQLVAVPFDRERTSPLRGALTLEEVNLTLTRVTVETVE